MRPDNFKCTLISPEECEYEKLYLVFVPHVGFQSANYHKYNGGNYWKSKITYQEIFPTHIYDYKFID